MAAGVASNAMPFTVASDSAEWLALPSGALEHTKWLDESRLRRLLGRDLNGSYVMLQPNKTLSDLSDVIVKQTDRFVAVVEPDKTFRCLIGRAVFLDALAKEVSKQVASSKS